MKNNTVKILIGSFITAIITLIIVFGLADKVSVYNKKQAEIPKGWHLVWSDEFNGKKID